MGLMIIENTWDSVKEILNIGFHFGEEGNQVHITIGTFLLVVISFLITSLILRWIRKLTTRKMDEPDVLRFTSIFRFIKYIIYTIVFFSILSFSGVNMTPVLAASAALLVGVGLALQELFQDVVGAILIMIDKSIRVGDIIEIEGTVGRVVEIRLRSTRAITRDDKVYVIPNHKFVSNSLLNYTQNHKTTREFVKVGVAYGSDTQKVKELLLKSVEEDNRILKNPKPFVSFEDFGDSALIFSVFFFISDSFIDPFIKSDIRFKIDQLFRENNVTIPFPQRDVHIFNKTKDR